MDQALKLTSYIFAAICMYFAFSGMEYVFGYFLAMRNKLHDPEAPLLYITYPIMAGINFLFFISLFAIAIMYAKNITKYWYLFPILMFSQYLYDVIISMLWHHHNAALSISVAAATGVAGGGTVIQERVYFWLWGSIICFTLWLIPLTRPRTPPAAQAGRA